MVLPKKITLFAEEIQIKKTDLLKRENSYGQAHYRYNEILIDKDIENVMQESAFFHELIHFILNRMYEDEINNEKFVNIFSALLHQALKDCLK